MKDKGQIQGKTEKIQSRPCAPLIHRFTGGPNGVRNNKTPTINRYLTTLNVFMLFLLSYSTVIKRDKCISEILNEGYTPLFDVTISEMGLFLSIAAQMGHAHRDTLKFYWSPL